jgi:hypothetical protein
MEGLDLEPYVGFLPPTWRDTIAGLFVLLVALRTLLRALVAFLSYLDVAIDGKADWNLVGSLSDGLDWLDSKLAHLPVKVPLLLEKRDHAQPVRKS